MTNYVRGITPDTLTKVETEYFTVQPILGAYQSLTIQTLFTQLGGTSDGTCLLQGSLDGVSYQTLNSDFSNIDFSSSDTLTITNGAIWLIEITNPSFVYYRITATGTASDTTLVTPKYIIKK
jgi:hypothetical protein